MTENMDALQDLSRACEIDPSNRVIKDALWKLHEEFKIQKEKDKLMKGFLRNVKYIDDCENGNFWFMKMIFTSSFIYVAE